MLTAYGDRIIVSRIPEPRTTSNLLIIPDTISDRPSPFGFVLNVGNKVREDVEVGDYVVLSDYAGAPCQYDFDGTQIDAFIVPSEHVLMVIEGYVQ